MVINDNSDEGPTSTAPTVATPRFHRIRHYPNVFSNFDMIEKCPTGPGKYCWGCEYKHVFCDEGGRVPATVKS